ncbi:thioredoxin family protein [Caminibacter sp.]
MRKMVVFFALALSLFAIEWSGKVNWAMGYGVAKELAKKEHKLIMVDVALSHCPPCQYLAQKVYTNDKVANYINKHFIPVFYLADRDSLPMDIQSYFTGSTPTIMFLKPNGELFYMFIGARPPQAFLKILENVNKKYKGTK